MRRIKVIWDFYGPDAEQTALHHEIHLNQFATKESLVDTVAGVDKEHDEHVIAYLVINETDVITVRDTLKPHRALIDE